MWSDKMSVEEKRREQKSRGEAYRLAAARLSGQSVNPMSNTSETADRTGAFVAISFWVPAEEMEKER